MDEPFVIYIPEMPGLLDETYDLVSEKAFTAAVISIAVTSK